MIFSVVFLLSYTCYGQIEANFNSNNKEACNSLQTSFFDQSTSEISIIDWYWEINGNTSALQNPAALFTDPGSYTICLTVTDVDGNSDTECKEDFITVYPSPISNFILDKSEGCVPVEVTFSNNASSENGAVVSWTWDVGGSAGVVEQVEAENFNSTYSSQGSYTASLTVIDEKGCSQTTSIPNSVVASALTTPDVEVQLIPSCSLPWEVEYTLKNADPLITYEWDFGNGVTYTGPNPPLIEYSEIGIFNTTINIKSGDCEDTIVLQETVNTNSSVTFSYGPSSFCQQEAISFTDLSLLEADSILWRFGDGNTSTEINPTHFYEEAGCYDVTLIRSFGICMDSMTISCIDIIASPAITYEITNQYNCQLPTDLVLSANSVENGTYSWELYNENISESFDENDVSVPIEEYGFYYAKVTFRADSGCSSFIDSIPINIAPIEAKLPAKGPSGCAPLSFTLSDDVTSPVPLISWEWSIGSPPLFTSNSSNPSFTLSDTGRYDIQLIVENIYGCIDTLAIKDYVKVGMRPEVNFEVNEVSGCLEDERFFTDLSSSYTDQWQWFFGEDGLSNEQNPEYVFPEPGIYDVALYATFNGCTDSLRLEDYITIFEPRSNFELIYNCDDPYTIEINNLSTGADSLIWSLHLSETDSIFIMDSIIGTYTLPGRGRFPISHYSYNDSSLCDHTFYDTIEIVDPIALYTLDTLRGCAPSVLHTQDLSQDAFTYEYSSEDALINNALDSEPEIVFVNGGIFSGPLMKITDIHGCQDSFLLDSKIEINKLTAEIEFDNVICVPDVANFKDISSDLLGNTTKWMWEVSPVGFIDTTPETSLYIDSIGSYDIFFHVEDDWGCKDSLTLITGITAVEILPEFESDSLGCSWAPIAFKALGDNGNVSAYEWDFGDGNTSTEQNPNHIYSNEGVYDVCLTMFDGRGCSKSVCKEGVVHISNPVANFIGDPNIATCPPLLTSFDNQSEKASSFNWNFGDNSGNSTNESPSHVYTSPGRFDVTLIATSTASCSDTLLIEEYIKVEGPVGTFTSDVSPTCIPIDVQLSAQSDGYYSYVWDLGNGILDSVPGLVIDDVLSYTYSSPGRFTPKLIITDTTGCSRSFAADQPIIVDDVNLEFTIDNDSLCGHPISINLKNLSQGTTDDINYEWQIKGPEFLISNEINPSIDINIPGLYDVSLLASYGTCVDTMTVPNFMEIADIPLVSFEIEEGDLCEGVNVNFINTSSVGYGEFLDWQWMFGDGSTSNLSDPSHNYQDREDKTITLIGITDKGCSAEFSKDFSVLPSTIAHVEEDKLICIGDETTLEGSIENLLPGGGYYWDENPSLSCTDCLSPIANPTEDSDYILTAVHPNGCESKDTIHIKVIPSPGPELSLSADSIICLGSTATIDVINFSAEYTYQWDPNTEGLDCYENCPEVNVQPASQTTYIVTVVNEYGCFKMDSLTIEVESTFEDFLNDTVGICKGNSTTIATSAGDNPQWQPDPEINCLTCSDNEVSPLADQLFYASVTSPLGCRYEDSISVIVIPENSIDAGSDLEICVGEEILLSAEGYGNPIWTANNQIVDSTRITTTYLDSSGAIYLSMTFDECIQEDSLFVELYTKAEVFGYGDTICVGEMATISAEGRLDSLRWLGTNIKDAEININPESTTEYWAVGEYRSCESDTAKIKVYVHPKIDYELEEKFYHIFLNDNIEITPSFDENRAYSFDWLPINGLSCSDCPSPTINGILESTDYSLLIIDEETDCDEEFDIQVRFNNECTNGVFHLPNIFSPNQDGKNDEFGLFTNNEEEFVSMQIYDRYGNLLFSENDINKTWNGRFNSQPVVNGVYVYKVNFICPYNGEVYSILGDVTVIR